MVDRNLSEHDGYVTIDAAWVRRELAEGVRIFFAPFVGAAVGFWRGATYGLRQGKSRVG